MIAGTGGWSRKLKVEEVDGFMSQSRQKGELGSKAIIQIVDEV